MFCKCWPDAFHNFTQSYCHIVVVRPPIKSHSPFLTKLVVSPPLASLSNKSSWKIRVSQYARPLLISPFSPIFYCFPHIFLFSHIFSILTKLASFSNKSSSFSFNQWTKFIRNFSNISFVLLHFFSPDKTGDKTPTSVLQQ